jgi:hypothetical protein
MTTPLSTFNGPQVLMRDGSELSCVSAALQVGQGYLMGSWCDKGLLLCHPTTTGEEGGEGQVQGQAAEQEL